jgi:16S rRNA processing protein RimM
MINLNDCIEIGRFTRSHGYKGQVIFKLEGFIFDEIINMEWVFVIIDGLPVPFFIENYSGRSNNTLLIKIENIDSVEKINLLINKPCYLSKNAILNKNHSSEGLFAKTGYSIIDSKLGFIGMLDSIIENSQNPLLRILDKNREIFLPLQEEFIDEINDERKEIAVTTPIGLLDIF